MRRWAFTFSPLPSGGGGRGGGGKAQPLTPNPPPPKRGRGGQKHALDTFFSRVRSATIRCARIQVEKNDEPETICGRNACGRSGRSRRRGEGRGPPADR